MAENNTPSQSPVVINVQKPEGESTSTAPATDTKAIKKGKAKAFEKGIELGRDKGANAVLKDLGVKKSERSRLLEDIKAGRVELAQKKQELADAKAAAEAEKVKTADAKAAAEALKPYQSRLKKYADQEFEGLPEPYQKTLSDMGIEDPMKRLDMIDLWRKNGVISAAQAPDGAPAPKEPPKPSQTMAKVTPPSPAPAGDKNHWEQWQALKGAGQDYLAAQYYAAHSRKILEQRPGK